MFCVYRVVGVWSRMYVLCSGVSGWCRVGVDAVYYEGVTRLLVTLVAVLLLLFCLSVVLSMLWFGGMC